MAKAKDELAGVSIADQEAALKAQLAELQRVKAPREQLEALDKGWLPQGVRLSDFSDREDGRNITFSETEAKTLMEPIRAIIEARLEGEV